MVRGSVFQPDEEKYHARCRVSVSAHVDDQDENNVLGSLVELLSIQHEADAYLRFQKACQHAIKPRSRCSEELSLRNALLFKPNFREVKRKHEK